VWALLRADILAPAVIWVRADAVNRNDTAREVSIDVGGKVSLERNLITRLRQLARRGAPFRPMSSVTARTWFPRQPWHASLPARVCPLSSRGCRDSLSRTQK
jgi:hypothetical protein